MILCTTLAYRHLVCSVTENWIILTKKHIRPIPLTLHDAPCAEIKAQNIMQSGWAGFSLSGHAIKLRLPEIKAQNIMQSGWAGFSKQSSINSSICK